MQKYRKVLAVMDILGLMNSGTSGVKPTIVSANLLLCKFREMESSLRGKTLDIPSHE